MEDWKPCSRILSHILDYMGYCQWMIDARKHVWSEHGKHFSNRLGTEILISGSKGEGISNMLQSDTDELRFLDNFCGTFDADICFTADRIGDPTRYMFTVERDWSPPGYCMLVLASRPTQSLIYNQIENCLSVLDKGVFCLKGQDFVRSLTENLVDVDKPLTGPSRPTTIQGWADYDNVPTISCSCSAELNSWYRRQRYHDWPSEFLQQDVISTPANAVAVGSKEGIFSKMEWRFCFNRAELKLIDSLNSTQTKAYAVLKMILKDYLKPENKEITSYVMKNIVFWMCESNPSSLFIPSTLLSWIYEGLHRLKCYIETGNLPYYMIPARNLLEGKFLDGRTKSKFLDKLSQLIDSGIGFVHVCESIKLGLDLYNYGLLEDYGWKRNLVEIYGFNKNYLSSDAKARLELLRLAGIDFPHLSVIFPDSKALLRERGLSIDEVWKLFHLRKGLFLNHEKADIYAQAYTDANPM